VYERAAASKANVLHNPLLTDAERIHFAVHGFLDAERPQLSALVLAPAPGERGYLTVREIFNLRLRADLIVLSACETGVGKQVEGEGILGLARAFLFAGAKSVVVSLWNVSDRGAVELMPRFYRELGPQTSKARALQQAKRAIVAQGKWANPYFWAPFILVGDPAPIPRDL